MNKNTLKSVSEMNLFNANDVADEGYISEKQYGKQPIVQLKLGDLVDFENHPFELYKGKRLSAMIKSIQEFGVITPIIVRPKNDKFEILAGHNRVNAARLNNLSSIPAIIKNVINDDEALLIVTETNFMQRSFSEMSYSERALTIYQHHTVLKSQGKRQDLLVEIEACMVELERGGGNTDDERVHSNKQVAEQYNFSARTVSRYLRVYQLSKFLQQQLDKGRISFTVAEVLSFLSTETQKSLNTILLNTNIKLTLKMAERLKEAEAATEILTEDDIADLLGKPQVATTDVRLSSSIRKKYFDDSFSKDEINQIIDKALASYWSTSSNEI